MMELAIEEMNKSIAEPRNDKPCPKVGAVLVDSNGRVLGTSFRGELREGDHAEFTLLERKFRDKDLSGCYLFTTLEPCAPGARRHPKLGCAERIVNARISKVWIGIEDPDPTVDRKGVQYLLDKGIDVEMFDAEFQDDIYSPNENYIRAAKQRAIDAKVSEVVELTPLEQPVLGSSIQEFSEEALAHYISRSGLSLKPTDPKLLTLLAQQELIVNNKPTGLGILLFGTNPRNRYPQAVIKLQINRGSGEPEIYDFGQALVLVPEEIEKVLKKTLYSGISRKDFVRTDEYEFPIEILRETIINALAHRDYDNATAKIFITIDNDKIEIKSPGLPVKPIRFEDFQAFRAPSLSRNPKIMYVFNAMKYVEERGIGMAEMKLLPQKYNLPKPQITWNDPYLSIIFPRSMEYLERSIPSNILSQLKEDEKEGLFFLRDQELGMSKSGYAMHFKIDPKKAQRHLSKFKTLKLVRTTGKSTALRYYYEIK